MSRIKRRLGFVGIIGGGSSEAGIDSIPSYKMVADTSATNATGIGAGDLRWNNTANQDSSTSIFVFGIDGNGNDNQQRNLEYPNVGSVLNVRSKTNSSIYQKWKITSIADNTTYVTYGVSLLENNGGNIADTSDIVVGFDLVRDDTAFHNDISGEINVVTLKASPVDADVVLIESSSNGFAKRRITIGTLPFIKSTLSGDINTNGFKIVNSNASGNVVIRAGSVGARGSFVIEDSEGSGAPFSVLYVTTGGNGWQFGSNENIIFSVIPTTKKFIVRDPSGTAGVDEMWWYSDGGTMTFRNPKSAYGIQFIADGASTITFQTNGSGYLSITSAGNSNFGGSILNVGGGTKTIGGPSNKWGGLYLSGPAYFAESTTSIESVIIPHGVAPTTPTDGSIWSTSAGGFYGRVNGVTKQFTMV